MLFYEYFHGDNGAGLGASHQTGWTGIIARAMHMFATSTAEQVLELGQKAVLVETESEWSAQLADAVTGRRGNHSLKAYRGQDLENTDLAN